MLKFREDREVEGIIKEIKQRPKVARKNTTGYNKPGTQLLTHQSKKIKNEQDNFTKSMKEAKKKPSPDKGNNMKSSHSTKNTHNVTKINKSYPEAARSEHNRITKATKEPNQKSKGTGSNIKPKEMRKAAPKKVQDALNKNTEVENKGTSDIKEERKSPNKNNELENPIIGGEKNKLQKFLTNTDSETKKQIENSQRENFQRQNRRDVNLPYI